MPPWHVHVTMSPTLNACAGGGLKNSFTYVTIFYYSFLTSRINNRSHSGHLAGNFLTIPVLQCQHVNLYLLVFSGISYSLNLKKLPAYRECTKIAPSGRHNH
jgi:hypothetical protein